MSTHNNGLGATVSEATTEHHGLETEKDLASLEVGELSDSEARHTLDQFGDEPPTGKWELWSWWSFYFANNSAGTLSYAPLSTYCPHRHRYPN
jgi:hypothetical protein